jgi:hypothetical protein
MPNANQCTCARKYTKNFDDVRFALQEYVVAYEKMDGTGFQIGVLANQLVLTFQDIKAVYLVEPANRELLVKLLDFNLIHYSFEYQGNRISSC